ncbi:MAG: thiamine pyrophosphate-binding protein [Candidatus Heimdallarchaeota archaeon]
MQLAKVLIQMLSEHNIQHIFSPSEETVLECYTTWQDWEDVPYSIEHVLARDERSPAYIASASARVSFKPGMVRRKHTMS